MLPKGHEQNLNCWMSSANHAAATMSSSLPRLSKGHLASVLDSQEVDSQEVVCKLNKSSSNVNEYLSCAGNSGCPMANANQFVGSGFHFDSGGKFIRWSAAQTRVCVAMYLAQPLQEMPSLSSFPTQPLQEKSKAFGTWEPYCCRMIQHPTS